MNGQLRDQAIFDFSFPRSKLRFRPPTPAELARLAGSDWDVARLGAALIRVALSKDAADEIKHSAG